MRGSEGAARPASPLQPDVQQSSGPPTLRSDPGADPPPSRQPALTLGLVARLDEWRRVYVASVALYPLWYLLTPDGATDSFELWLAIGMLFLCALVVSHHVDSLRRHVWLVSLGFSFVATLHVFTLAALNDMRVFYGVGSVTAGVMTTAVLPTASSLRVYAAWVAVIAGALALALPDPMMLAYWAPLIPFFWIYGHRLSLQRTSDRRSHEHQLDLERIVEEHTRFLEERSQELSAANRRLRDEMEERSRLERELRTAQKLEALGRLSGGVAHDFNNLLTAIRGYADLLTDSLDAADPRRDDADQVRRAADQAAVLTKQLLDFSRSNHLKPTRLDLNAVVAEQNSMLRALLGEDIAFEACLEDSLEPIRANASQIQQVLVNLAMNARDAMPSGGLFRVETRMVESGALQLDEPVDEETDRFVVLSVTDSGVGMDDHTAARVFDPFFTTKEVGKGTGLGLSSVHGIVKQSQGHLRLRSAPGQGTTIEIHWPPFRGEQAVAIEGNGLAPQRGCERILLVEDREDVRGLVARVLTEYGYEVLQAADAAAALELVQGRNDPIDLVITDVVMPQMSGFELVERLSVALPETKVLFISGQLNHPSLRSRDLPPGTELLPKPFPPSQLKAKVRELLDGPLLH